MKQYQRHLIACNGGDCKDEGGGKKLLKVAKKALGKASKTTKCSKVSCLGQCKKGPIFIVYPDGVWYHCPDKAALERIIEEHVKGGKVVQEYVLLEMDA